MKSLISINYKFMSLNPKKITDLILQSKNVKGVEAYIDCNNEVELKYLNDLVFELKKNNLVLQIHGNVELEFSKQLVYIKKLEEYADYLNNPIVFTLHSIYDENDKVSLEKTIDYFSNLLSNIDNNKIIVCLENLNDARGFTRLGKEEIRTIILNDENIFFTYDIGHELADYGKITNLDKYMIEDIRNVHIHSHNDKGVDHLPIYKNDIHWNDIIKGLIFLNVNKYKYNIVYEYGLEFCKGNTVEEKVIDYLNSIDYVSERYKENNDDLTYILIENK